MARIYSLILVVLAAPMLLPMALVALDLVFQFTAAVRMVPLLFRGTCVCASWLWQLVSVFASMPALHPRLLVMLLGALLAVATPSFHGMLRQLQWEHNVGVVTIIFGVASAALFVIAIGIVVEMLSLLLLSGPWACQVAAAILLTGASVCARMIALLFEVLVALAALHPRLRLGLVLLLGALVVLIKCASHWSPPAATGTPQPRPRRRRRHYRSTGHSGRRRRRKRYRSIGRRKHHGKAVPQQVKLCLNTCYTRTLIGVSPYKH